MTRRRYGQLHIVYTSKYFQPNGNAFDETYHFVGSSLLPRADAPPFPYEALDRDKPLVYISLGTLFNAQPEFYRRALAAFAQSRYQVVLSVGRKTPISSLGTIPSYVIMRASVPQLAILQCAALFITRGALQCTHKLDQPLVTGKRPLRPRSQPSPSCALFDDPSRF